MFLVKHRSIFTIPMQGSKKNNISIALSFGKLFVQICYEIPNNDLPIVRVWAYVNALLSAPAKIRTRNLLNIRK